jgi:predicted outer membrane repeat protein
MVKLNVIKRWFLIAGAILILGGVSLARAQKAVFAWEGTPPVIHVPKDVSDLQTAISQVPNGGIIELAAGVYASPTTGWFISNQGKSFTIQAATSGSVILDGGGSRELLRLMNSSVAQGGAVVFKGLQFKNGYSTTEGTAGGITIHLGEATFEDCVFENNQGNQPTTGGGAVVVAIDSTAFFFNTSFIGNRAKNFGAGLAVETNSIAYVHASYFLNNRVNYPHHLNVSAGGGIHVGDSTLRVTNTRFEGNEAGYVGGAIYAVGTWVAPYTTPHTNILIANSTFVNNQAERDPTVSLPAPTEAGAIHFENQTLGKIYNSRFITNSAMTGGGVNLYRATVEIENSVFQGNFTTSTSAAEGFGGAIAAISSDTSEDGNSNYPSANLTIRNTLIQGRYSSVSNVSMSGGGIYLNGDSNRMYGLNGVSKLGTLTDNRMVAYLEKVMVYDTDVFEVNGVPGSGVGGGIMTGLTDLTISDAIIAGANIVGTGVGSGGGIAILDQSLLNADKLTLIGNSAPRWGGGVFGQGSTLNLNNCILAENSISVAANQTLGGAALYTAPDFGRNLKVNGTVSNCTLSNNTGIPVFDGDANHAITYNDMQYNENNFFTTYAENAVYSNSLGPFNRTVEQLNNLTIMRSNGPDTDKSQIPNTSLNVAPKLGTVLNVPTQILPTHPSGDPAGNTPTYVGYAWSGGSATLNGNPLTGNAGLTISTNPATYTLVVGGTTISAVSTLLDPAPTATFTSTGSNPVTLSWNVTAGNFLDAAIDQSGGALLDAQTGSVTVFPSAETTYRFLAVTKEGGTMMTNGTPVLEAPASFMILTGLNLPTHQGAIPIRNLGGGILNWTATSNTPDLLTITTPSGQIISQDMELVAFESNVGQLTPGSYSGEILINGGSAGSQTVSVTVKVVNFVYQTFLPFARQ